MSNDCIEWTGCRDPDGYGHLNRKGYRGHAHRWTWMQAHGTIPSNIVIRHTCDNRACVNLEHLEPGTQADNIADRDRRNRRHIKLTVEDAAAIRSSLAIGEAPKALATRYGVHISNIHQIGRGAIWKPQTKDTEP